MLTPEQQSAALHGTSQLYLALRGEVDAQLHKFETYAVETCLHVPAGLLVAAAVSSSVGVPLRMVKVGLTGGPSVQSAFLGPAAVAACMASASSRAAQPQASAMLALVLPPSPPSAHEQSAAAGHSNAAAPVDEAEEAAVDEQLAQLRRQIVSAKQTGGVAKRAFLWGLPCPALEPIVGGGTGTTANGPRWIHVLHQSKPAHVFSARAPTRLPTATMQGAS